MATAAQDYKQLVAFLEEDSSNTTLIVDTANAALAAGRTADVTSLAERHRMLAGPSPAMDHLVAMAAMADENWSAAAASLSALLDQGIDEPGVRYNLAWSLTMMGDKEAALPLLDDAIAETIPQGAQLLVGLLHERGELERAEVVARAAVERFPEHRGLNAAVSTLAIDLEDVELARAAAERAGDHPDALVTLATLALDEEQPDTARSLFETVLARDPNNPRARVGRGLVALVGDDRANAAVDLDHGAELFGDHLGSWIAAGWAHVLAGDNATARERFERALSVDDGFAEAHGSLAVLDLMVGDVESGRRRTEVAQRLDRESFAAALAAAMLAAGAGDRTKAERIVKIALDTPVDGEGRTIGQALARLGARG